MLSETETRGGIRNVMALKDERGRSNAFEE